MINYNSRKDAIQQTQVKTTSRIDAPTERRKHAILVDLQCEYNFVVFVLIEDDVFKAIINHEVKKCRSHV